MSNLDRVSFGGETVDRRTAAMLAEAERIANAQDPSIGKFHLGQGSWSHVAASAGTHGGPGAFDMDADPYDEAQKEIIGLALRTVGFASWLRDPSQGNWQEHWHGIAIDTPNLPPVARDQVASYRQGRNGLAGNGLDDQPRPAQLTSWEQYQALGGAGAAPATRTPPGGEPAVAGGDAFGIEAGRQLEVELDSDQDGLSDAFEQLAGTREQVADSDGDGLSDGYEAVRSHTDPLATDTDRDGTTDGIEVTRGSDAGRQPGVAGVVGSGVFAEKPGRDVTDTDDDGLSDRFEGLAGTDARQADSDGDQLPDATEIALGTNPGLADSDHDGVTDGFETARGRDALSSFTDARGRTLRTAAWTPERAYAARTGRDPNPGKPDLWAIPEGEQLGGRPLLPGAGRRDGDADQDGLTDAFEALAGTDAKEADSDHDGVGDGYEAVTSRTDPRSADTDGSDVSSDADRVLGVGGVVGTGAAAENARTMQDADADGLSDRREKLLRTRSDSADTDGDQILDATEVALGTDPRLADTDGDGLADGVEVRYQGDPLQAGTVLGPGLAAGLASGLPAAAGADAVLPYPSDPPSPDHLADADPG